MLPEVRNKAGGGVEEKVAEMRLTALRADPSDHKAFFEKFRLNKGFRHFNELDASSKRG